MLVPIHSQCSFILLYSELCQTKESEKSTQTLSKWWQQQKKRIVILFSIFHWFSVLKCSWCENINYLLLIWKRFMFCGLSLMDFCALFRSNNRNYCFKYTDFYICILRECSSVVYILKWTNSNTAKNIECEISKWYCNISV